MMNYLSPNIFYYWLFVLNARNILFLWVSIFPNILRLLPIWREQESGTRGGDENPENVLDRKHACNEQ
jgi:hypothetical protein